MEKPKCKICEHRHWSNEACKIVSVILRPDDLLYVQRETEAPKLVAPAPKFDRVAYQREYMRKWRAMRKRQNSG